MDHSLNLRVMFRRNKLGRLQEFQVPLIDLLRRRAEHVPEQPVGDIDVGLTVGVGGVLLQAGARLIKVDLLVDREQMTRISGAALDYLALSAVATIQLSVVMANWMPLTIMVVAGIVWTVFAVMFFSPRLFKEAWFERGIAEFGQATGVTATGLLLLRREANAYLAEQSQALLDGYGLGSLTGLLNIDVQIVKMGIGAYLCPFLALLALLLMGIRKKQPKLRYEATPYPARRTGMPPERSAGVASRPAASAGSGWTCPNCGQRMGQEERFCGRCGTERPRRPALIYCTVCGRPLPRDATFCCACGAPVEKETASGAEDRR